MRKKAAMLDLTIHSEGGSVIIVKHYEGDIADEEIKQIDKVSDYFSANVIYYQPVSRPTSEDLERVILD